MSANRVFGGTFFEFVGIRLLRNTHLLRCTRFPALRRTMKYAWFLEPSRALHPDVSEQPEINGFFNSPAFQCNGKAILTDCKKTCMMALLRGGFLSFEPCGSGLYEGGRNE
jgi:hypothetical protein